MEGTAHTLTGAVVVEGPLTPLPGCRSRAPEPAGVPGEAIRSRECADLNAQVAMLEDELAAARRLEGVHNQIIAEQNSRTDSMQLTLLSELLCMDQEMKDAVSLDADSVAAKELEHAAVLAHLESELDYDFVREATYLLQRWPDLGIKEPTTTEDAAAVMYEVARHTLGEVKRLEAEMRAERAAVENNEALLTALEAVLSGGEPMLKTVLAARDAPGRRDQRRRRRGKPKPLQLALKSRLRS